jgi:beta-glucosidase
MLALRFIIVILFSLSLHNSLLGQETPLYKDVQAPLEQRVTDLLGRLTQDEKLLLLGGTGFTTQPIPRLGVPAMGMCDAGQGVRGGKASTLGPATAFPCGVLMASTWDTNLIWQIGRAIGEELRNKGTGSSILLGPAVNIHRSPLGGRNAEYFSEDPYLVARLAVAYIQGVQSYGVGACIKHFACNNEEQDRFTVNAKVSERALREIYLPAFEAGVKEGHVLAVMSSYNLLNGLHSTANPYLLTDVLKKGWGFDGLVMSDWWAVHETAVVQAGNDLEMPTGEYMNVTNLQAALADGSITQAAVDDSVRRILRTIIRVGLLDKPMNPDAKMVNSPEHAKLAYTAATKGIVLLKNEHKLLPLDRQKIKSVAVIGEAAQRLQFNALGSPEVRSAHRIDLLEGIKNQAGPAIAVRYAAARTGGEPVPGSAIRQPDEPNARGFRAEYFANTNLAGAPALVRQEERIDVEPSDSPAPGVTNMHFSVRWTGKLVAPTNGTYHFTFYGDGGFRVFLDGKLLINRWIEGSARAVTGSADLEAGKSYDLRVERFETWGSGPAEFGWQLPSQNLFAEAVAAAHNSDVAIVCVSTRRSEGEGNDRPSLELPEHQDALIRAVAAANKNTIVVLNAGSPVDMKNWMKQSPALIQAWFPGQEGGAALAAILFGDVNPSGKLPDTLAANREDYPDAANFPGKNNEVNYAEGIYVGYRHFDKAGIRPLFPFGYGLSYTTFDYKNLKLSQTQLTTDGSVTVSADISNTGKRVGEEVAELYIHALNPKMDKPVRELKGFAKVALNPGETKTVQFTLTARDLASFDVPGHQWKADAGKYEIEVGASSRDLRLKAPLSLTATYTNDVPLSKENYHP